MARAASFKRFLAELRRRDVFRVVTAYGAAAFVVYRDHSGEFMAGAVAVWVVASLLVLRWALGAAAAG